MKREKFGSKIGIIAAAAGSAIGLGNIWKFPYMVGKNGGAAFILVYLICILLIGIPVMIAEFALGRKSEGTPVDSFRLHSKNSKWGAAGYMSMLTSFIILSFYSIIAGWVLSYVGRAVTGVFNDIPTEQLGDYFGTFTARTSESLICTAIIMIITASIVMSGVKSGIEKFSKIVMPLLVIFIIILMGRSLTLDGAMSGIEFLFKPDFSQMTMNGVLEALGHSFYTLSVGMAIILVYGSYMDKKENIVTLTFQIAAADTIIALMAGVVIFPAVFAYGLEPTSGPGLIFITLPAVFKSMPFGRVFSVLFFVLIAIAAVTSTVSLMESVVSFVNDRFNMNRKTAVIICTVLIFGLSIPSMLSFSSLSHITIGGRTIFDFMDFITNNILIPLGGLAICIYAAWVWGCDKLMKEVSSEGFYKIKIDKLYRIIIKYVSPIGMITIFMYSLGIIG